MSSVRMCDKCGTVFSENEDGWSTFTGTRVTRDDDGRTRTLTIQQDSCGNCTNGMFQVKPKVIETSKKKPE